VKRHRSWKQRKRGKTRSRGQRGEKRLVSTLNLKEILKPRTMGGPQKLGKARK
jgi:hypothetical protein